MYLLTLLTALLPRRAQRYAKAAWPAIGTLVAVGAQWVATGELDQLELVTAITGLGGALLTAAVPNR